MAIDGDVGFVVALDRRKAEEAEHVFDVQWRYIHGTATQAELDRLPRTFNGHPVVRDGRELKRLANAGRFTIEPEQYAELFS